MRYLVARSIVGILLFCWTQAQAGEPSLGERLDKIAPRAAGIAQVEVMDIKEFDHRGGDGDLYLDVRLRILQGTGVTPVNVYITLARGGNPGRNAPPFKPYGPVKSDTFKKGERYWVAFSSPYDSTRYPQGVITSWPDKDGPKVLTEAIRSDHYAHRPIYDADIGLTYSDRAANDKKSWRVRMERDGKLLWEVDLPGEKYRGYYEYIVNRFLSSSNLPSDLGYDKEHRMFLFVQTATSLEDRNPYSVAPGKYKLRYALNPNNGRTAAIYVTQHEKTDPSVMQYFDRKTGKIRREERYDFFEKGGLAVGSKTESWLRKIVREYDAENGKLIAEEVLRSVSSSTYVPVDKK